MDPGAFSQVKSAVSRCHFKDEKLNALRSSSSAAQGYFSADQIAELLSEFSFDDGKLTALEVCSQRMLSSTCVGVVPIVGAFSFVDKKVRAVEVLLGHITDRVPSAFDSVIPFSSDRNRVREILERSPPAGPYPGSCPAQQEHHHHHHHHHQPGYPGMPPPAGPSYPGMAPAPGPSYPGMPPPAGHSYPGMPPPAGPGYPGMPLPPGPGYPMAGAPPPGAAPMPFPPGGPGFPLPGVFPPGPGHHHHPF